MIEKFLVKGLFGLFDNEIAFKDGKITVIVGINGCGKTTMLHMLSAIFSKNHSLLLKYKFDYIELEISNHILKIEPIDEYSEDEEINIKTLRYFIDSKEIDKHYRENRRLNSAMFWSRMIPSLRRISSNLLKDSKTGEVLTLQETINEYFDELPNEVKNDLLSIPQEVFELVNKLKVELISTERLKRFCQDDDYVRPGMGLTQGFAVEECSDDLGHKFKTELSKYANTSQKLDEQFPSKILKAINNHEQLSIDELKDNIEQIDALREKHVTAGVLEENNDKFLNIDVDLESIDESTAAILTVYYQDMKDKLESLNNISDRIVLFKDMLTTKFSTNKNIHIDKENGITITQQPQNEKVALKDLSSGEQQELVLLYNLIFNQEDEKLILIDEPEISLNVSWQREFLADMKKIVEMNNFSVLIATHSPQIINENWDLVETIGEVE